MTKDRILALDLATKTGFHDGERIGSIKFDRETRVNSFWDWLRKEIKQGRELCYDVLVIENALNQPRNTMEVFHELKTVVKLVTQMADIPLFVYSPNHVKKVFTGNGHAKKDEIIKKCLDMGYELPYRIIKSGPNKGEKRYDDDAADAIALYHTYLFNEVR